MENRVLWPGWETVRMLGRGSFGAVYEIERDVLGEKEKAALKVITIPQSENEIEELYSNGYDEASITAHFRDFLSDIVREYTLMLGMKGHTNVVTCDDIRYVQHDDGFGWDIFIKMELLTPLTKALGSSIPEEQAVRLGRDLCRALVLCRSRNILHRDIKPQNIFVSRDGDYKLGDFGIAKTVEKTSGGTKIGTYNYMAPEVYNNRPYGHAADICSLGLVLYWMLNERRLPFNPLPPVTPRNADMENARARRFSGEPIPAPLHGSPELQRIVLKACAFDPKDRYQSAEEMLLDLERLGEPTAAPGEADATLAAPRPIAPPEEEKTVAAPRPRPEKQGSGRAEANRQPRAQQAARKAPPGRRGAPWPLLILLPLAALGVVVIALVLGRGMGRNTADGTEAPPSAPELTVSAAASTPAPTPAATPDPTPAATPAPTPEPPLTASVSTVLSDGRTLLTAASAEASSFINASQIGNRNVTIRYPACAIDGNTATSWQEAADGYGIDQWLTVYLEGTPNVRYLSLWLGNWESGQMYGMNGRPSALRIEFSDGSSVVCDFPDEMAEFEVKLSRPVQTTWVRFTVLDAYEGTRWEDTCISEIRFYA